MVVVVVVAKSKILYILSELLSLLELSAFFLAEAAEGVAFLAADGVVDLAGVAFLADAAAGAGAGFFLLSSSDESLSLSDSLSSESQVLRFLPFKIHATML